MMYNRYVPDAAGVYRPTRVEDVPPPPPVQPPLTASFTFPGTILHSHSSFIASRPF